LAAALTVTCTVCAAQGTSLSASDTSLSAGDQTAFARSVLPEQKATPVLAPFRAGTETLACRKQTGDAPYTFGAGLNAIDLALPAHALQLLSCQSTAGETTRGPPLMDPPRFC
jgi:hypothetical protein